MTKKIIIFLAVCLIFSACWKVGISYFEPQVSTAIAVGQVNYDSTQSHAAVRAYQQIQNWLYAAPVIFSFLMFGLFFGRDIARAIKPNTPNHKQQSQKTERETS